MKMKIWEVQTSDLFGVFVYQLIVINRPIFSALVGSQ